MRAFPILAGLALIAVAAPDRANAQEACTGPASPYRLYVNVENVRSGQGLIAVTLYADNPRKFLAKRGSLYVGRVPAKAPVTRACIYVPQPGIYGLAIYHDADGNRSFKRTGLGLPAEGYGFSNNAPALFGLPSFSRVRMSVPKTDTETRIKLRYP